MKSILAACLLAVALLGVAFRPGEAPRIAVIDMSRLLSQHKDSLAEQDMIGQWYKTNRGMLDEQEKGYNGLRKELEQYQPDSDEFRRRDGELKVKKFELEQRFQALHDDYERKVGRSMADAHARVKTACQKYLDEHDQDVILQYSPNPVGANNKSGDVVPEIVVRTVVAFRKTVDVTDAVLAILDASK